MTPVPRRTTFMRSMSFVEERLRLSLVTMATRAPAEQEPERVIGAAGQPAFENGWQAASGFGPPRFWRTSAGWVHLAGVVEMPDIGNFQLPMFTLPEGYRPPFEQQVSRLAVPFGDAPFTAMSEPVIGTLYITAENRANEGSVRVAGIALTGAQRVSLDGLRFRTT